MERRALISAHETGSAHSKSVTAMRSGVSMPFRNQASRDPKHGQIRRSCHMAAEAIGRHALDAANGILFAATGNPAPDFYGDVRKGSNLHTNSAVALDVRTGKVLWIHQFHISRYT